MRQTLYQYTDAPALAGIVEQSAIRATDYRYLNDSVELSYTWDAFLAQLRAVAAAPDDGHTHAYSTMLDAIGRLRAHDIRDYDQSTFVACFTELGDDLNQWSRYGYGGRGVALGFDADKLRTLEPAYHYLDEGKLSPILDQNHTPVRWPCFLQQVAYGDTARDDLAADLVEIVRCIGTTDDPATDTHNYMSQLSGLFHRLPLVKDAAFSSEREHRITATEYLGGMTHQHRGAVAELGGPFASLAHIRTMTLDVKFRPSAQTLFTPYVELPLPRDALVTVVLGPAVTDPLAPATVRRMLDRHGYADTTVQASQLPYKG